MSKFAMNGFFDAWQGGARGMGKDIAEAINSTRQDLASMDARREAIAEADRLNNGLVEVDTGEVSFHDPATGTALDKDAARQKWLQGVDPEQRKVTVQKPGREVNGDANVEALYLTKFLPQQVKKLRDNGSVQLADRLEGYVTSETGQQHSKLYANMVKAHASGNFAGAAKFMEQLQELSGEDTNATVMADGKGGYKMRLQNTASGSAEEYELDESRLMGEMGMFAYMDPVKMVDRYDKQAKAKADNLVAVAKEKEQTRRQMALQGLKFKQDVQLKDLDYRQDIAKMVQQNNLDLGKPTDKELVYNWLERNGQPRAVLDQYVAGIVEGKGNGGVRQAPNPQDLVRQYISDRSRDDSRFAELDDDEKVRKAMEYVRKLQGAFPAATGAGGAAPSAAPPTRSLPPMLR